MNGTCETERTERLTRLFERCAAEGIRCERDVPLAQFSSFQIGGPADLMIFPAGEEQLAAAFCAANELSLPLFLLGNGSNVLFADEGFRGAVIQIGAEHAGIRLLDECTVDCDSGAALSALCVFAWEHGLSGLEFAFGIPGSVGGAIYMNAGAYGGEIRDVLQRARHLAPDGTPGTWAGDALDLSYRHSAYMDSAYLITGGVFRLTKGDKAAIRAQMDDYMNRRREKQPLEYPSAGSTFKRPPGAYASALIEQCGLKGRRVGGAVVSEKHAGFIVNTGGATCADVLELVEQVRFQVAEQTGHQLSCEIRRVDPQ